MGIVSNPHAGSPRGAAASAAKIALFVLDYACSWVCVIGPLRVRSTLVIFDRYFHDLLVDGTRYRLPQAFAPARCSAALIPQPDMWLILTAKPETLVARKGEITPTTAAELTAGYQALADRLGQVPVISTELPLNAVLTEAVASLEGTLARRARRHSDSVGRL